MAKYEKIKDYTNHLFLFLLEIIFPRYCIGCGEEGSYICKDCEIFLSEVPPSKEVFSIWECDGLMEKIIWQIKYRGTYHIIDEVVQKIFEKMDLNIPRGTIISYVPMDKKKERKRGFNQAELIAKKISETIKVSKGEYFEVMPLLTKIKENLSQVGLSPEERVRNVKGVFSFFGDFVPENVLLVDDVYTTGATTRECIKILKRAGIKTVQVFTIAKKLKI